MNHFSTFLNAILTVKPEDIVLIIYDEHLEVDIDILVGELSSFTSNISCYYLPTFLQKILIGKNEHLMPLVLNSCILSSTIIINALSSVEETTEIRKAIINTQRKDGCKLAHFPNLSLSSLELISNSDLEFIQNAGQRIAWLFGETEEVEIKTYDRFGKEYHLKIELDIWENDPIICDGIIRSGSWGNPVPGEVFCCPKDGNVNGEICINGSFYKELLNKDEEFVIQFLGSKAIRFETIDNNSNKMIKIIDELRENRESKFDFNWNTFAELGVGLNQSILSLVGNPIIDEKMFGTIHIALGDNSAFGHKIQSSIHYDLTIINPTVRFDGKTIIHNQDIIFDNIPQDPKCKNLFEESEFILFDYQIKSNFLHIENGRFYKIIPNSRRYNKVLLFEDRIIFKELQFLLIRNTIQTDVFYDAFDYLSKTKQKKMFNWLYHYNIIINK